MSMAWETTTEDVWNALERMNETRTEEEVDAIHDALDHDAIEKAALHGDDMLEQTEYATEEIINQIENM